MADAGRSRRARTTADGGAGRCLSDLSDDLLRRIVFLAPDKDGAATAVLSRRWRWLWRTSGAVHVDCRSFCPRREREQKHYHWAFPPPFLRGDHGKKQAIAIATQEREAFFRGAEQALAAAAAAPIRRLTFFLAKDSETTLLARWWTQEDNLVEHNLMETLVSHPAARHVEELRIDVRAVNTGFKLSLGCLPSEALRVLRISRCSALTAGATASLAFPMLVDLHLQDCNVSLVDLQRLIHAAPRLSKLHLASTHLSSKDNDANQVGRLLIPSVSVLDLEDCSYWRYLELQVPRLLFFRYRGESGDIKHSDGLSLKSHASDLHVDLELSHGLQHCFNQIPATIRESFWRIIQNFSTAKHLTLRVQCFAMEGLAFVDQASLDELLGGLSLSRLEQLELEAEYYSGFEPLLANFLHCCPMVRDIRITLIKKNTSPWIEPCMDTNEGGVQFDKSVSSFRNRRRSRSMVSSSPENGDNYKDYGVIPGLTGEHSFSCLQNHLKRVSLHFFVDEPNCLAIKLAKFFAKNAMVLQELLIDDGSHEMLEHANSSVRRWIANTDIYGNNKLNVKDYC